MADIDLNAENLKYIFAEIKKNRRHMPAGFTQNYLRFAPK